MTKDILFLCQFFFPDNNSSATLPFDTARFLADKGYSVDALVGYPKEYSNDADVPLVENVEGINITRIKYLQLKRSGKAGRLINYFSFTAHALSNIRRFKKYRSVIVYSNPPVLPVVPIIAKRKYGTKVIFVSYDVYPEIAIASDALQKGSIISRTMDLINSRLYSTADRVVTLTDEMKSFLLNNREHLSDDRVCVIPNWAHEKVMEADEKAYERFGYAEGQFVVAYFGNMGTCQDVETLLGAAELLKDDDRVRFLLVGHGNKVDYLRKAIQEKDLRNIQIHSFLTGEAFMQAVAISSCCVLSLEKGLKGLCAPSKYYSYLQGGKPVLAVVENESYLSQEVKKEEIGFSIEIGDRETLKNSILELLDDAASRQMMGKRARSLYADRYSYDIAMNKYLAMFRSVLG